MTEAIANLDWETIFEDFPPPAEEAEGWIQHVQEEYQYDGFNPLALANQILNILKKSFPTDWRVVLGELIVIGLTRGNNLTNIAKSLSPVSLKKLKNYVALLSISSNVKSSKRSRRETVTLVRICICFPHWSVHAADILKIDLFPSHPILSKIPSFLKTQAFAGLIYNSIPIVLLQLYTLYQCAFCTLINKGDLSSIDGYVEEVENYTTIARTSSTIPDGKRQSLISDLLQKHKRTFNEFKRLLQESEGFDVLNKTFPKSPVHPPSPPKSLRPPTAPLSDKRVKGPRVEVPSKIDEKQLEFSDQEDDGDEDGQQGTSQF
jgi:hypothetical protein